MKLTRPRIRFAIDLVKPVAKTCSWRLSRVMKKTNTQIRG